MNPSKRPRHYAADIIALPTVEQRRSALALVPSELRDWVAEYVSDHFTKQRYLKAHYARHPRQKNYHL